MIDPMLSLSYTGLFLIACFVIFRPDMGFFWRWQRQRHVTDRVLSEDTLKHLYKNELIKNVTTLDSVMGAIGVSGNQAAILLDKMVRHGLLQVEGTEFKLTKRGRGSALHILRAHRLWEHYLAEQTGFIESEWHDRADRHEHQMSADDTDSLSNLLGNPTHDPHGDPIPTASGDLVYHGGKPLSSQEVGHRLYVVHLEDEPKTVYSQLVALGLHPGMEIQVLEISQRFIRIWAAGDEHVIAPILASNISVVPIAEPVLDDADESEHLSNLDIGRSCRVLQISRQCRGLERRRLLDLGVLPGTVIKAEMRSPSGDPTAYRIREAVIGLRKDQARMISVVLL